MIHAGHLFLALGASETALALFKRARTGSRSADRGSFATLWMVIGLAIFCGIFISRSVRSAEFAIGAGLLWGAVGLFLFGLVLRWWAIVHLGRFFTVDVAIANDHRVVDDGPYRLVRHPSYTGALLEFLGLAILLTNWLAGAVLFLPVLIALLWRIRIEEKALVEALGPAYQTYMQCTWKLVPYFY